MNCLTTETPFTVFQHFGFQSGRNADKFSEYTAQPKRTADGLIVLPEYINAYMSLKVEKEIDLGSHGMFLCEVREAGKISETESCTYNYYQNNIKPKPRQPEPAADSRTGWVCRVCGYVYEGDELPEDFICPICRHPAGDFEKMS